MIKHNISLQLINFGCIDQNHNKIDTNQIFTFYCEDTLLSLNAVLSKHSKWMLHLYKMNVIYSSRHEHPTIVFHQISFFATVSVVQPVIKH